MSSICGADCSQCQMKETCKGCSETKGQPFGGSCVLVKCCYNEEGKVVKLVEDYKKQLIEEINAIGISDMQKVEELVALNGAFVNMEYTLANGQKIKLLNDKDVYLGTQLAKVGSDRCYGIAADNDYILICEYGNEGENPEIVVYKKRSKI